MLINIIVHWWSNLFYNITFNKFIESVSYIHVLFFIKLIKKREIIYFILSILVTNVLIINFDGMFVSSVSGQSSSEKESQGFIVFNDPKLKSELVVFRYFCLTFYTRLWYIKQKADFYIA